MNEIVIHLNPTVPCLLWIIFLFTEILWGGLYVEHLAHLTSIFTQQLTY
jgi:hypothetical protein